MGPVSPSAAILRKSSHIVSVLTTVVLVADTKVRVTAFHAPSTLNRCRPAAARTKSRVNDHRQHRKVPYTKCATATGRPSLACDLIEEFRTPVVDAAVVAAVNRRVLTPDDFEDVGPGEPVRIRKEAIGTFARVIERKLESTARYEPIGKKLSYRQILEQQCRHLARCFMSGNVEYMPYRAR